MSNYAEMAGQLSIAIQAATQKERRAGLVDVAWWTSQGLHRFWELSQNAFDSASIRRDAITCRCRSVITHDRVMNLVENGERR